VTKVCTGVFVFLLLFASSLFADSPYPRITSWRPGVDPTFRQFQDLVDQFYLAKAQDKPLDDLTLFTYRVQKGESLLLLASVFNLPYETLATLNGLPNAQSLTPGEDLLVPSQAGLFLALKQPTEIDRMIDAREAQLTSPMIPLTIQKGTVPVRFQFYPGERFSPLERAFFLGILFRFPLPRAVLTSSFGMRINPFSGHPAFHAGIDLAAPTGTAVYAARDGDVSYVGTNVLLGHHIVVSHGGGYETVYGHLSRILVSLHQHVLSGMIIGRVGSTGMSTGPHLHFEIRKQGVPENPVPLLPGQP